MEINLLEDSKNKLVMEIKGDGSALCNALKTELWQNKSVKTAGYTISHPLVGAPTLIVETKTGSPKQLVLDSAKNIKKDADAFLKSFNKNVK